MECTLITGASSGLGWELAQVCAQNGENLILVARRKERLEELKILIQRDCNVRIEIFATDIGRESNRTELFRYVEQNQLEVTFLINNAGLGCNGLFVEQARKKERSLIDVNIAAVADLTHHFLGSMMTRNTGRILCIASMAGFQAGPLMASYFASKAFVVRLVQAIHFELQQKQSKVRIVAYCPGPFESEFGEVSGNGVSNLFQRTPVASTKSMALEAYQSSRRKQAIYVPGIANKLGVFFSSFVPQWIQLRLVTFLNSTSL
jgi:uncharacterized protein